VGHHPTHHKPCPRSHPGHGRQQGLVPPCTLSSACPTPGTAQGQLLHQGRDSATTAYPTASSSVPSPSPPRCCSRRLHPGWGPAGWHRSGGCAVSHRRRRGHRPREGHLPPGHRDVRSTELFGETPPAPAYLDDAVLGGQARRLGRRVGVDGTHVLPRAALVAVQVEAVAVGALLHAAQPRPELLLQRDSPWESRSRTPPQHPGAALGPPDICSGGRDIILGWPPAPTDTSSWDTACQNTLRTQALLN